MYVSANTCYLNYHCDETDDCLRMMFWVLPDDLPIQKGKRSDEQTQDKESYSEERWRKQKQRNGGSTLCARSHRNNASDSKTIKLRLRHETTHYPSPITSSS